MTLAILSALPQEQAGLVDAMSERQSVEHAGRTFWRGMLFGHEVVCALCGIGKVAAATTTTALIERFGVERIVFTGVAGGIGAGVQVGDVVVAADYLQHDMNAWPIFPQWEMPGYGRTRLTCDVAMTQVLLQATQACLDNGTGGLLSADAGRSPRTHHGLIASGDQFISTSTASRQLYDALNAAGHDVMAVEMEGASVAQVCWDYGVPFAAMRTISDRADDSAHVDFTEFVNQVASRYAQQIVQNFLLRLPRAS
jgi:adenosylhomocysteine nucleosidase